MIDPILPPPPETSDIIVEKGLQARINLLLCLRKEGETLGDTEASYIRNVPCGRQRLDDAEHMATCSCDEARFPGILLGLAHGGNTDYGWVVRCAVCAIFNSDDHAAFFLGRFLGYEVGFAVFDPQYAPRPHLKGLTFEQVQALETGKKK